MASPQSVIKSGQALKEGPATSTDEQEAREKANRRIADRLDAAISEAIGKLTGGWIVNQQFRIDHEFARPTNLVFSRCYPHLKLLVEFFPTNFRHAAEKELIDREVAEKAAFAEKFGYKFLAVYDGSVNPIELATLLREEEPEE